MSDNKDVKQFKCMNFGACAKADAGETIEIDTLETLGGIPECPHCHQHTLEEIVKKPFPIKLVVGIAVAVLALGGIGYGVSQMGGGDEESSVPTTPTTPTDTTEVQEVILAQEIKINEGDISLEEGETSQLTSVVIPEKIDEALSWSSDNESAVTVDPTGKINAVKAGTSNIKLATEKSGLTASVKVTVTKKENTGGGGGGSTTTYNLGWGRYDGPMAGGKPHGFGGTITVSGYHSIDLKKASGETVEVNRGDKIMNVKIENGRLRQGEIHFADGTRRFISGL